MLEVIKGIFSCEISIKLIKEKCFKKEFENIFIGSFICFGNMEKGNFITAKKCILLPAKKREIENRKKLRIMSFQSLTFTTLGILTYFEALGILCM